MDELQGATAELAKAFAGRDSHGKGFLLVGRMDAEKLEAFEQWYQRAGRFLQNPFVEGQPTDFLTDVWRFHYFPNVKWSCSALPQAF